MQIKNVMRNKCNQKLERVGLGLFGLDFFFSLEQGICRKPFNNQTQNLLFSNLKKKPQL